MSSPLSGSRRLGLAAATMLSIAALTLSGCTGGGATSNEGGSETASVTVFNGATGTIAENFNPFSSTALQPTLGVIFEPLFWYNAASDKPPTPLLGESFEWNKDGTQLTIKTRKGVKWSDGQPFTAKDVAFTFNLVNKTPALNTTGLAGTAEATDDTTVVLTFEQNSFMQEPSVLGNRGIVPEHIWKDVADPITEINSNPVGTGPFKVKEFTAQSYLLEKNDVYWEQGKPAVEEVRYISLDTADAATGALLAGEVDWMSTFLPGLDKILADNKNLSYVNTPALTASIFTCSNEQLGCEGPQTDPAVRQAIYKGIDREQLNALAGGGFAGTASPTLVLPKRDADWIADSANAETPANANVEEARKTLEDAGWVEGSDGIREKNGERLSLGIQTVTGYSDFISLNDAMAQQLREVGIELKPTQITYNEWINNLNIGKYQLTLESIGLQPSNNPYYTYEKWYNSANTTPVGQSALNNNTARYTNPVVDKALAAARSTNDESVQKEQYGIIQKEIVRDMPYIPIYVNSLLTEFNTARATGWPTNEDPYALAATWKAWDNGVVLKNIKPAK